MNIAIIAGRLGHSPELKSTPTGLSVTTMGVATSYYFKNKSGENEEVTDWHNVVAYGRTAETMAQYLKGGDQVIIHGKMKTRSYEDKNGGPMRYRTEIIVERFEFGAKSNRDDRVESAPRKKKDDKDWDKQLYEGKGLQPKLETIEYPEDDINVDDIPF